MEMTRNRGKPVTLPDWWLEALRRLCANRSGAELADQLNKIARRSPPWLREAVNRFLNGQVTTIEMMDAFLELFGDDLPPPVLFARSYEEAVRLSRLARSYDGERPQPELDVPRVAKTEENYDEAERSSERSTSTTA